MPSRLPVIAPSKEPKSKSQKSERTKYANSGSDPSPTNVATPSIDLNKPIYRRPRLLSREAFDAIRLKAREVDEASLKQLHEFPDPDDSDAAITIVERVNQHRRPLSSLLISTTFHLILFLLLTVLIKQPEPKTIGIVLDAAMAIADPLDRNPVDQRENQTIKIEITEENQSPVDMTFDATAITEDPKASEIETTIPSPLQVDPSPTVTIEKVTNPVGALPIKPSGGGLEGRDGETRGQMAAKMGGSADSEAAVENGLAWIINHQLPDGSWQLKHDHEGRCNGQCPDEGAIESTTAATGLALMALLGAGYTHKSGPYQKEVEAGLKYLVSAMRMTKRGGHMIRGERGMYSHAIATIALAACSDAQIASYNVSKAADMFEVDRRIVFYNGITDSYMLTIEGRCSIEDQRNQLEVTCKKGQNAYVKHFLGLSDNVTYFAEQLETRDVSTFHHRIIFKPQSILPDVDFRGSARELTTMGE